MKRKKIKFSPHTDPDEDLEWKDYVENTYNNKKNYKVIQFTDVTQIQTEIP